SDPAVDVVGFDMRAALVYPEIRARGIKPSDSIHLACASVARVNLLLTNDADLTRQQIPDIAFITTLDRAPL
ncbi:MAG TPA: type II toxin-antitoxin system VapC family toxin, partial [Bryobacteraceae bacterium]|nr:type II toxin-antitoxin system VapC family toxin [Bryobacteraceae bacterium]